MNWKTVFYFLFLIYVFYKLGKDDIYSSKKLDDLKTEIIDINNTLTNLTFGDVKNFTEIQKDLNLLDEEIENPVYYHNVSGIFIDTWSGQFLEHKKNINISEIEKARGDFDYSKGTILYNIYENGTIKEDVNIISGYVKIKNKNDYTLNVKGMHFISDGYIALYGIPIRESYNISQYLRIFTLELPKMMLTKDRFNDTVEILQWRLQQDIEEIDKRLKKDPDAEEEYYDPYKKDGDNSIDQDNDENSEDENNNEENDPTCHFNIFFKLKSVNSTTDDDLLEYENELKSPTGIKPLLRSPPPLEGDSLLYSDDCEIYIKLDNSALGKKIEIIVKKYTYSTIGSMFVTLMIIILYAIQEKHTPSQPALGKVSGISQVMISFLNLIVITVNIIMGTSINGYNSILYITSASFKGISFIFFEKNYIMKVLDRQFNLNDNGNANVLIICYWLISFVGQIFILTLLNGKLIAFYIIMFILYSYWIPQIIFNIKKNAEKPLSKIYLYGISTVQLYILVFIYNMDVNINIENFNKKFIYIIAIYTALQILILSFQDKFGPLFLIPERFLPQRYNYHPILPISNESDEEKEQEQTDTNDESTSAPLESISVNQECAICFANIVENNKVNNKDYMVTPCHHIFHTECLKHWMNIKMECPVCRSPLPQ